MRRMWLAALLSTLLLMGIGCLTVTAQEPTAAPEYDPQCAVDLMKAYMSGWEYNHRGSEGTIDIVAAAQVARQVHAAFANAKIDCKDTMGGFKESLLRSMHGDYSAEDLARTLSFVDEAIGNSVQYDSCDYTIASQFIQQVDWGQSTAVEVGRAVSEIFRAVREALPGDGGCNGTFFIIQEILSHIEDAPPDGKLVSTLYQVVGQATEGHYVSEYTCNYTLAKTFLSKVEWDGLTSTQIVQLVNDTFTITYKISGDDICDRDPALAITAMLLDDAYRFPPDASVIQNSYDAATGKPIVPTPEATPIVN